MNPLNDERLALNQKFIDLINEYQDTLEDEDPVNIYTLDAKGLFKYIWNKDYMLVEKDYSTIF